MPSVENSTYCIRRATKKRSTEPSDDRTKSRIQHGSREYTTLGHENTHPICHFIVSSPITHLIPLNVSQCFDFFVGPVLLWNNWKWISCSTIKRLQCTISQTRARANADARILLCPVWSTLNVPCHNNAEMSRADPSTRMAWATHPCAVLHELRNTGVCHTILSILENDKTLTTPCAETPNLCRLQLKQDWGWWSTVRVSTAAHGECCNLE